MLSEMHLMAQEETIDKFQFIELIFLWGIFLWEIFKSVAHYTFKRKPCVLQSKKKRIAKFFAILL